MSHLGTVHLGTVPRALVGPTKASAVYCRPPLLLTGRSSGCKLGTRVAMYRLGAQGAARPEAALWQLLGLLAKREVRQGSSHRPRCQNLNAVCARSFTLASYLALCARHSLPGGTPCERRVGYRSWSGPGRVSSLAGIQLGPDDHRESLGMLARLPGQRGKSSERSRVRFV